MMYHCFPGDMDCDEQMQWRMDNGRNPSPPDVGKLDGRNGGTKRKCRIGSKSGEEVTLL